MPAKALPNQSLEAVALDRPGRDATRDGKAKAGLGGRAACREHGEVAIGMALGRAKDGPEFGGAGQPCSARQALGARDRARQG